MTGVDYLRRAVQNHETNILDSISSHSILHLQINIANSIKSILGEVCLTKRKLINTALHNFEAMGPALIEPKTPSRIKTIARGEGGLVLFCKKVQMFIHKSKSRRCCNNLPASRVKSGFAFQEYVEPFSRHITVACDPVPCSSHFPVWWALDSKIRVCQTDLGLHRCTNQYVKLAPVPSVGLHSN